MGQALRGQHGLRGAQPGRLPRHGGIEFRFRIERALWFRIWQRNQFPRQPERIGFGHGIIVRQ